MRHLFLLSTFLAAAVVGSAAVAAEPVAPEKLCDPRYGGDNPTLTSHLRTERNINIRLPEMAQSYRSSAFESLPLGQGYTRLVLHFQPCPGLLRDYHGQRRHWLPRLLAGKSISKLLSVRASLPSPAISTVHPIATVGHDSSRRTGEAFSTEISNQLWLTPYFRLSGPTNVSLDFVLNASSEHKNSVATDALELVKRAAGLIAPTSALVTDINKDRFNEAASFVDSSISNFLKQSIVERRKDDYPIVAGERNLVALALRLPGVSETLGDSSPVGVWVVSTDRIIPSIFDPAVSAPKLAHNQLSSATILNFEVAPGVKLRESLSSRPPVTQARDEFLHATADGESGSWDDKAIALCNAVEAEAQSIGLVPMDVGAVLWAYADTLSVEQQHRQAYFRACGARPFYPEGDDRVLLAAR